MNYIQRLFDTAAPAHTIAQPAPMAGGPGTSPVVAADQRLGIFPDLMDSFMPRHANSETVEAGPARKSPRARRSRAPALDDAAPQYSTVPETGPPRARNKSSRHAPSPATAAAPETRVSALQRLVESDPLPAPAAQRSRASASAPATPEQRCELAPEASDLPSTLPLSRLSERVRVAPDPLQVAGFADAELLESPQPGATPLMPSNHEAHSLAAAWLDPFRSPAAATQDESSTASQPERIIERILEVPVAPSAPPRPMTAAGQSVIGSLDSRRAEGWRPRQESL